MIGEENNEEQGLQMETEDFDLRDEEEVQEDDREEEQEQESAEEDQRPKIEFTEEQQEYINTEILGKKTRQLRTTEVELQQARAKLAEYQKEDPLGPRPEVPELPDKYDPEFDKKLQERESAIEKRKEWDFQSHQRSEQLVRQQEEVQQKQINDFNAKVDGHRERSAKKGIQPNILAQAGQVVGNFITNMDIVSDLIDHEESGPMIVYLAKHVDEAEKINGMTPARAGAYLDSVIKPRATRGSKKKDPPPETISGGRGAVEGQKGPEGATYIDYN